MKPAEFDYTRPTTLQAALGLLAHSPTDTRILAGGQSLVPMMNFRLARPKQIVDINRLQELAYIRQEGLEIAVGALARHSEVMQSPLVALACPLIIQAYQWVAHHIIRARGTLCGNLCHADPASEMPAVMLAIGATLVARSADKQRVIAADDFFTGLYATALTPAELLVEVRLPACTAVDVHGFSETNLRKGDFALCCVAGTARIEGNVISQPRIAVAGLAERALRLSQIEAALEGKEADGVDPIALAHSASDQVPILGDRRAPRDYKCDLLAANLARALDQMLRRSSKAGH